MQELTVMNNQFEEERVLIPSDPSMPPIFSVAETGQWYLLAYLQMPDAPGVMHPESLPIFTAWWLGDLNESENVPYTGGREL